MIGSTPVIDGLYLTAPYINLSGKDQSSVTNSVPVLMGVNRDEGGVLGTLYNTANLTTGIIDVSASSGLNATAILASDALPLGTGPNPTKMSSIPQPAYTLITRSAALTNSLPMLV